MQWFKAALSMFLVGFGASGQLSQQPNSTIQVEGRSPTGNALKKSGRL
jgi:hypothetical protein